jgi:NTE family protein
MARNVALVLSSGGARGIAHIGVIKELIKSGFTITSVAGTSMGSVIGGLLAQGTLDQYSEWLLAFTKMDMIKFLDLTTGSGGLIKGEKIMKVLSDFIGDVNIEDLSIPFACVAADLASQKEIVFSKGSLIQAVRASSSIPTVFLPVAHEGMLLVDGGVLNPLPLDIIHRNDGDIPVSYTHLTLPTN